MKSAAIVGIATLIFATPASGQDGPVLFTQGEVTTVLVADSIDDNEWPTVRFITARRDSQSASSRFRGYELNCSTLRTRLRLNQRWIMAETAADPVFEAAYPHLCVGSPDRWTFMFEVRNGEYQVDRATVDSVPRVPTGRRVWIKTVHDTAEVSPGSATRTHERIMRFDFDCSERRMRTLARLAYDDKGSVISSFETPADSARWSSVVPDSNGENMAAWVCSKLDIIDKVFPVRRR